MQTMEPQYWTPTSNLNSSTWRQTGSKRIDEISAGRQNGAIELPTEEIEWSGTTLVSYKPPTAYKTLNPTQNSTIRGKFELPRALILSFSHHHTTPRPWTPLQPKNELFHLNLPRIPRFLQYPTSIHYGK